jgi:ribosomal-protein-alanine N-acetyltransferase
MNESHVAQIAALERECFSDPWSEASIASELHSEWSLWLVDEEDGQVVAYVGSQSAPPDADVMNVAVAPSHRRQGRGEALMLALMDALRALNRESLSLEVRQSNAPALALYRRLGFVQVGKRPKYYHNPVEDALILRKELVEC